MIDLCPVNGSYFEAIKLKSQEEERYVFILNKINETLDYFRIKDKRDSFSEALIRLTLLEFDLPMHGADDKAKVILDMLSHFKKIVQS